MIDKVQTTTLDESQQTELLERTTVVSMFLCSNGLPVAPILIAKASVAVYNQALKGEHAEEVACILDKSKATQFLTTARLIVKELGLPESSLATCLFS